MRSNIELDACHAFGTTPLEVLVLMTVISSLYASSLASRLKRKAEKIESHSKIVYLNPANKCDHLPTQLRT